MPPRYNPGRILLEALAAKGMTQEDLAALISVDKRHVHNVCRGYAGITPSMALLLANAGVNAPEEFTTEFPLADAAERWAALSAAHRVYRLRKGLPELESPPGKKLRARRPAGKSAAATKE